MVGFQDPSTGGGGTDAEGTGNQTNKVGTGIMSHLTISINQQAINRM